MKSTITIKINVIKRHVKGRKKNSFVQKGLFLKKQGHQKSYKEQKTALVHKKAISLVNKAIKSHVKSRK